MKFFSLVITFTTLCFSMLCGDNIQESDRFFVVSPPKTGTFLIGKVMSMITKKEPYYVLAEFGTVDQTMSLADTLDATNQFLVGHNYTDDIVNRLVKKGYKVIFIYRDPRDQLISIMNWMREGEWSWLGASKLKETNHIIEELITGSKYGFKAYEHAFVRYETTVEDLSSSVLYFTRFENLVGDQGGGTKNAQINEILNLADFVGVELDYEDASVLADLTFGNTMTFRSGKIGAWKKYFTPKHKNLYKRSYQNELKRLGYEKDMNW
jgi:hypothetical protein